jgi:two-component system phosphate regulon sensor histidine kinase PhoR
LITFYHPRERILEARAAHLEEDDGRRLGVLVILRDLTALYRLERIRRDFVANVSHELKTPITSIKGFIETVLDDTRGVPEQTQRFLRIIAKQTQRMDAIIDDLLMLARLENQSAKGNLPMEDTALKPLIESACEVCAARAEEKKMDVRIECADDCRADLSGPLIEQALVNLVDNAVKYSEPGLPIVVSGRCRENELEICVSDRGCGIEKEHLDRLFERFYRADRVRSRNLGGTGLGLAIVKHIVMVHDGRVSVESRPGKGSEFTLLIPRRRTSGSQNFNESLANG